MPHPTVLLVSRDQSLVQTVRLLSSSVPRLRLETCGEADLASGHLRRAGAALILVHLPSGQADTSIAGLLQTIVAERCTCAVVVLADEYAEERRAALLRAGAADWLTLPAETERLAHLVDALTLRSRLSQPTVEPEAAEADELADALPLGMAELVDQVRRVAPQETTLLLTGETGTGKTHLARLIHQLSPRQPQPFQVVDCCALSPALVESTLFGHVRGAFTGADRDRPGKLASVGRGTLLLDEINSLPAELQGKLLRAVEERVFEPVGSDRPQPLQARLIAASNVPLEREVAAGRFRADLYYRLNVVGFYLPPLRERPTAIPSLVKKFLSEFTTRNRPDIRGISEDAMQKIERYSWPGNIRELRNVVERVVALSAGPQVHLRDLPETIRLHGKTAVAPLMRVDPIAPSADLSAGSLNQAKEAAEVQRILLALKKHSNNRLRAAAELGISRMGLYKKLHRYGLIQSTATANLSWENLAATCIQ